MTKNVFGTDKSERPEPPNSPSQSVKKMNHSKQKIKRFSAVSQQQHLRTDSKSYPHTLEDLTVSCLIDYPGMRGFFLRRLSVHDFKNEFNRFIFSALHDIKEPVNISTIYKALAEDEMAAKGVAYHLAVLSGLSWKMDCEGDRL
ncbi:hypothetical protein ACFL0S_03925 [Thermodesulfobacteriota bacterium]